MCSPCNYNPSWVYFTRGHINVSIGFQNKRLTIDSTSANKDKLMVALVSEDRQAAGPKDPPDQSETKPEEKVTL